MSRERRFRELLPAAQSLLAVLFGGLGLRQRYAILNRPLFEGQTLWDTTGRFHVWPWPYKLAAVSNFPAFLAGTLISWPLAFVWPGVTEYVANLPALLFVPLLWYWVGFRLDRRWRVADKTPWIALSVFTLSCLAGAFLPIGYTGFLPYGFAVWVIATFTISRHTHVCSGIPIYKSAPPN